MDTPTDTPPRKPRIRLLLLLSGLLGAAVAVVPVALPVVVSALMPGVQVGQVSLDPFAGRIELLDLSWSMGEGNALRLGRLDVQVGVSALWEGRVHLGSLHLHGLSLSTRASESSASSHPPSEISLQQSLVPWLEALGWQVGVNEFRLTGADMSFAAAGKTLHLRLDEVALGEHVSWQGQKAGPLSLAGRINGAPFTVTGTMTPFSREPGIDLKVAFNDLAGGSLLDDLQGRFSGAFHLRVGPEEEGLRIEHDGELSVKGLAVAGVTAERGQWSGQSTLLLATPSRGKLMVKGQLKNSPVSLVEQGFSLAQEGLAVDLAWDVGGKELRQEGGISLASLDLSREGVRFTGKELSWNGAVTLAEQASGKVVGSLKSGPFSWQAGKESGDHQGLEMAVHFTRGADKGEMTQEGKGVLKPFHLVVGGDTLASGPLAWQGIWRLDEAKISFAGQLNHGALRPFGPLGLQHGGVSAQLKAEAALDGGAFQVEAETVSIDEGRVAISSQGRIGVGKVAVSALSFSPDKGVKTARVVLSALRSDTRLTQEGVTTISSFSTPTLEVAGLVVDPQGGLSVKEVTLGGGQAQVERNGVPVVEGASPPVLPAPAPEGVQGPVQEQEAARVALDRLLISSPVTITVKDQTVVPPFHYQAEVTALDLADVDSARSGQGGDFSLEVQVGKFSRLVLAGQARPFAADAGMSMHGEVSALELPPFSPLAAQHAGVMLDSGSLDATLVLDLSRSKMEGKAEMTIQKLVARQAKPDEVGPLAAELNMPLETALGLLKDGDGVIKLSIPITGSPADPQFDTGDAVKKAVAKAARMASLTAIKMAIQPFGAILTAAELAGKAINHISLDPLLFEPGLSKLDEKGLEYAGKMAELLKSRPSLGLRLCGVAVPADREALVTALTPPVLPGDKALSKTPVVTREELLALAKARAEGLKESMVELFAADAGKLFICRPRFAEDEAGKPRVEPVI